MTTSDLSKTYIFLAYLAYGWVRFCGFSYPCPWTFSGDTEVTVNIFANAGLEATSTPTTTGWGWSAHPSEVMSRAIETVNDSSAPNFDDKYPYPFYFQLADGFGWQTYRDVFATYNEDQSSDPGALPANGTEKKNQWLVRWSQVSGYDMVEYMVNAWGLEVDQSAIDSVTAMGLPTWMPLEVSEDMLLWLDAKDNASIELEDGEVVTWNDKSGDGNHAIAYQAEKKKRPARGTLGLLFEDDFMEIRTLDVRPSTHDALTSIAVYKYIGAKRNIWVGQQNGFGMDRRTHLATETDEGALHISTQEFVNSTPSRRVWLDGVLEEESYDASTSSYGEDGAGVGLGQRLYAWPDYAGAYPTNFELMELIVYNRALTDAERQSATTYLQAKWLP